jgi:hypothetical protein
MEITAQFYGGPRDGAIMSLPEPRGLVEFTPLTVEMNEGWDHELVDRYEIVWCEGHPARNGSGHVRYAYRPPSPL